MKYLNIILIILFLFPSSCILSSTAKRTPNWAKIMQKKVKLLEKDFEGEFGIYVYDLENNDAFNYNADELWYLSSAIKVPVAIGLMKMVDQKKVKLSDKVTISKADYRDGAGPVNWLKPGSKVSYRYLLKQMLIYSDNAATDLIIKKVGLNTINFMVQQSLSSKSFGPITTLLDVRKKAYGNIHPKAKELSNTDYFLIKKKRGPEKRLKELIRLLRVEQKDLVLPTVDAGFDKYYEEGWNSSTLVGYAELLKKLLSNQLLSKKSTRILLKTMTGIQTGKKRIRKGLSRKLFFTHKTGTQHRQACDIGMAGPKKTKKAKVLILVCTKKWEKLANAEKLMAKVGKMVSNSKLFKKKK